MTDKLLNRVKRIKGQMVGIEKMVEKKRDCLEVVQQIKAARSALDGVLTMILTQESCQLTKKQKPKEFAKIVSELVKKI